MGTRGRNRQGHYLALLYALELQYRCEQATRGDAPLTWQPSPRNRPDQFLSWILDALRYRLRSARTLEDLYQELHTLHLQRVSNVLKATLERSAMRRGPGPVQFLPDTSLAAIAEHQRDTGAQEAHPQARKIANLLSNQLDARWREAVERTMSEIGDKLPPAAQLLGGLPPGFRTINEFIYSADAQLSEVENVSDLTVLEFYALVTGSVPKPGAPLRDAAEKLDPLRTEDILELRHLESRQLQQLRALTPAATELITRYPSLRRAKVALNILANLSEKELNAHLATLQRVGNLPELLRKTGNLNDPVLKSLQTLTYGGQEYENVWQLVHAGAWEQVKLVDEETLRMIDRGSLSPTLLRTIPAWDEATVANVRRVLSENWWGLETYLEGVRGYSRLKTLRSPALLSLRDVFPQSVAYLDGYFAKNSGTILAEEIEDVSSYAIAFSTRVLHHVIADARASPHA